VYDLPNNQKEFPIPSFKVADYGLFFIELEDSFQTQLQRPKIEICDFTSSKINLCIFSSTRGYQLEEQEYTLTIWKQYLPIEFTFEKNLNHYPLQIIYLPRDDACEIRKTEYFSKSRNQGIKSSYLNIDQELIDMNLTQHWCNRTSRKCFLMLSKENVDPPRFGELKNFSINESKHSCNIKSSKGMRGEFRDSFFTLSDTLSSKDLVFNIQGTIELKDITLVTMKSEKGELKKRYSDNQYTQVTSAFFNFNDRKDEIWNAFDHFEKNYFKVPVLKYSIDRQVLTLEENMIEGRWQFVMSNDRFLLKNEYSNSRAVKFESKNMSVNHDNLDAIEVCLFLKGLTPAKLMIKPSNLKELLTKMKNKEDFQIRHEFTGNSSPEFLSAFDKLFEKRNWSVEILEDEDYKLQIVIYDDDLLKPFTIYKGFLFYEGFDLEKYSKLDPKTFSKVAVCKIGNDEMKTHNTLNLINKRSYYWKTGVIYQGFSVVLLDVDFDDIENLGYYRDRTCKWNSYYEDKNKLASLMIEA